jgi:hypothetical protein
MRLYDIINNQERSNVNKIEFTLDNETHKVGDRLVIFYNAEPNRGDITEIYTTDKQDIILVVNYEGFRIISASWDLYENWF